MQPEDDPAKAIRRLEALLIHGQARLEVLEAFIVEAHKNDRVGNTTVDAFLRSRAEKRLDWYLASISDRNPSLATELAQIISNSKSERHQP